MQRQPSPPRGHPQDHTISVCPAGERVSSTCPGNALGDPTAVIAEDRAGYLAGLWSGMMERDLGHTSQEV